jgi:hypothetical protein
MTLRLISLAILTVTLLSSRAPADPLLICGSDEVFLIDTTAAEHGVIDKLWSWRAKDHAADLPERLRNAFVSTDDCKPIRDGASILISSSSGGCALVERPSGRVLWYALVHNAHSLELLPRDRVIAASSVGEGGDRLVLFDLSRPDQPLFHTPLPAAHGVVWDDARKRLWALGQHDVRAYALNDWDTPTPSLDLIATHPLPDGDSEGHDLQPVPHSPDLCLSTYRHVYLFDRDHPGAFRPYPDLADRSNIKCVSIHPTSARAVVTQGTDNQWWCDTLRFLAPAAEVQLKGERMYKARWLTEPKRPGQP